jgi:hypothetical protein
MLLMPGVLEQCLLCVEKVLNIILLKWVLALFPC